MAYSILVMEKIHDMGSLQTRHEHNFRTLNLVHVDANASYRNEELINFSGLDYRDLWYRRLKEIEMETGEPVKRTKASVLAYEFVVTFSHGAEVDVDAWKQANVKWFCDTFGEKNVLSMQLHHDEATPHIHAIVIPIDDRNHLCARSFTGGRAKMRRLQDSYGNAMKEVGLQRGEKYSRTRHVDISRFYAAVNKAAKEQAPQMIPGEPLEEYVQRVNAYIQDIQLQALDEKLKLQRKIDVAETKVTQLTVKYREAIELQEDLEDSFQGEESAARERLRTYRIIEHSVPRVKLDGLLESIKQKFPVEDNVLFFLERRRKKKKKDEKTDGLSQSLQ